MSDAIRFRRMAFCFFSKAKDFANRKGDRPDSFPRSLSPRWGWDNFRHSSHGLRRGLH